MDNQELIKKIMTKQELALCEPFLVEFHGDKKGEKRVKSVNNPLPTQGCSNLFGICEPFLVPNFGERDGQKPRVHSIDEPVPTVTSHGAGALVMPEYNGQKLDIKFRMLQPHELAKAMSFENYQFSGKKVEIVKQIGNAVPVNLAKHLCLALL